MGWVGFQYVYFQWFVSDLYTNYNFNDPVIKSLHIFVHKITKEKTDRITHLNR